MNCSVYMPFVYCHNSVMSEGFWFNSYTCFLRSLMEHYSHHIVRTISHLSTNKRSFLGHELMK